MDNISNPMVKIAFYNDKIDGLISKIDLERMPSGKARYELKLLKEASKRFTKFTDRTLGVSAIIFADVYDHIDEVLEKELSQLIK